MAAILPEIGARQLGSPSGGRAGELSFATRVRRRARTEAPRFYARATCVLCEHIEPPRFYVLTQRWAGSDAPRARGPRTSALRTALTDHGRR